MSKKIEQEFIMSKGVRIPTDDKRNYPSLYLSLPEAEDRVEDLAGLGLSKKAIALVLGVEYGTFTKFLKEHPSLESKHSAGSIRAVSKVAGVMYEQALGGSFPAMSFFLKNRAAAEWSDKQEITHSGPPISFRFDLGEDPKDEPKDKPTNNIKDVN